MKIDIKSKEIELIPLEQIIEHPKNANRHSLEQIDRLVKLIEYQGFRSPLVISKRSGFLVSGHGRKMAAAKLNIEKLPCIYQDFENEAQEYAYVISENEIARWAELDRHAVYTDMKELELEDIELLGIEDFEIPDIESLDPQCDEDEVPELKEDPVTKRGDVWLLGKHRLMCGDSTMLDEVEKLMDGDKADLVITDPPYNVAYEGKTKDALKIKNDEMSNDSFYDFLLDCFSNYFAIMNTGAGIYVFHADLEGINFRTSFKDAGLKLSQVLIWEKHCMVMGRSDYHWKHEPILYGWKEGSAHKWFSDRKQVSVWKFDRPMRNDIHPTMKPIKLLEYPILNSTQGSNNIVCDLFLGSGSTLIASENTGRRCYGMELDERYCDVIIKRYQEYTGKEAILETTSETYNSLKGNENV